MSRPAGETWRGGFFAFVGSDSPGSGQMWPRATLAAGFTVSLNIHRPPLPDVQAEQG